MVFGTSGFFRPKAEKRGGISAPQASVNRNAPQRDGKGGEGRGRKKQEGRKRGERKGTKRGEKGVENKAKTC